MAAPHDASMALKGGRFKVLLNGTCNMMSDATGFVFKEMTLEIGPETQDRHAGLERRT